MIAKEPHTQTKRVSHAISQYERRVQMKIKIFVRTFTSNEDAELFNSLLKTKWPELLKGKKGVRFRLVQDAQKPHVSLVVWEFSNEKVQVEIETLIEAEILRFVRTLPNKQIHFQGEVTEDFAAIE